MTHEYMAAECLTCGWKDQFRKDFCHGDVAHGFCEQCNQERGFYVSQKPSDTIDQPKTDQCEHLWKCIGDDDQDNGWAQCRKCGEVSEQ